MGKSHTDTLVVHSRFPYSVEWYLELWMLIGSYWPPVSVGAGRDFGTDRVQLQE